MILTNANMIRPPTVLANTPPTTPTSPRSSTNIPITISRTGICS